MIEGFSNDINHFGVGGDSRLIRTAHILHAKPNTGYLQCAAKFTASAQSFRRRILSAFVTEATIEPPANASAVLKSLRRSKPVPSFLLIKLSMFDLIKTDVLALLVIYYSF